MRKLLIMASLFYPQKNGGGPPVSIMNVVQAIKGKFEIYVITHNHEVGESKPLSGVTNGWNDFDFGRVYYFSHDDYNTINIYNLICEIKPDVIYQNSFFSHQDALATLKYKKKNKSVGVVVAPRGEVCEKRFAKGKFKKSVYTTLLRCCGYLKNVFFQATAEEEAIDTVRFLGIPKERIYTINNFSYANDSYIKPIEKKKGELKLCFIARIQDTKNLLYAIERLKNVKGEVTYDVYGPIENKSYYEQCFSVELPENVSLNYCGFVDHDEVGKTISNYHAYYMPTLGENYGHSIVEGMLYKRPVIISDMTPWTPINEEKAGFAISLDNPQEFEGIIEFMCNMEQDDYNAMCENAKKYIDSQLHIEETIARYVKCFNEV